MRSKRPWGLFGYSFAVWGVLLLVALLIAFASLWDVEQAGDGSSGAFLYIGLPIFLVGLGAPILLLKALTRWSRDVEGDESEFHVRDVPKDEAPHPVTTAAPQDGNQPPVAAGTHTPPLPSKESMPSESMPPARHPQQHTHRRRR